MRTALPSYFVTLFYFLISDGDEITVSLYLHQNDSILSVNESNFVWQGKIKSLQNLKVLECFLTLQRVKDTLGPGFDSRTRRHMWAEFVACSLPCSERFFSGYSGFALSSKPAFPNSNSIWIIVKYFIMSLWLG